MVNYCRYTSTPLHTVNANNIVQISSSDRAEAELNNSDALVDNDYLTQTASVEFSNQDIESHVLTSEIDTNKLEKF